jgi:hypothetical protein
MGSTFRHKQTHGSCAKQFVESSLPYSFPCNLDTHIMHVANIFWSQTDWLSMCHSALERRGRLCAVTGVLQIKPTWCALFPSMFISFLVMFRATLCPSPGEITVSVRHLVFVTVCGWLSGNILRKTVHQVGFIYKIIQGCTVNKT